jgi:hypothetical protein
MRRLKYWTIRAAAPNTTVGLPPRNGQFSDPSGHGFRRSVESCAAKARNVRFENMSNRVGVTSFPAGLPRRASWHFSSGAFQLSGIPVRIRRLRIQR